MLALGDEEMCVGVCVGMSENGNENGNSAQKWKREKESVIRLRKRWHLLARM